jgi:hypothetical protein
MRRLIHWFCKPAPAPRRRRTRLLLEPLDERCVLSVSYHGGALLPHVEVEPLYYGQGWINPTQAQQASDLNVFLGTLVNSPYMDMLNEYGVGRGSLSDDGIIDTGVLPGQTVDDLQIQNMLLGHIYDGLLQAPDANRLYVIYTAPNVIVTQAGQTSVNDFFGYHNEILDAFGRPVYYAVIVHPVGNGDFYNLNDFQTLTKITSHEVAESATNPEALTGMGPGGWFGRFAGYDGDQEIGDVEVGQNDVGPLDGYVVQKEWSQAQGRGVLPVDPGQPPASPPGAFSPLPANLRMAATTYTHSFEYFAGLIQKDYQQFLGRTAAPSEVSLWVGAMQGGMTDEAVVATFASSPEFYTHAGGTDKAWVDALYQDLLGRPADSAGEGGWLNTLAAGAGRFTIAWGFAAGPEREALVVQADYATFLGRQANSAEVAGWVYAFEHGYTNEQVVAGFVSSPEYFHSPKKGKGNAAAWVASAYLDLFHRSASPTEVSNWVSALG